MALYIGFSVLPVEQGPSSSAASVPSKRPFPTVPLLSQGASGHPVTYAVLQGGARPVWAAVFTLQLPRHLGLVAAPPTVPPGLDCRCFHQSLSSV